MSFIGRYKKANNKNIIYYSRCFDLHLLYGIKFIVYKVNGHVNRVPSSPLTHSRSLTLKSTLIQIRTVSITTCNYCTSSLWLQISCKMRICIFRHGN